LPWIDFGSGNSRVLNFYNYEIAAANGLPSQPKFLLYVQFRMKGNVQIRSDEQPDGESDTLIIINARCSLSFETLISNRHIVTINLYRQDDIRMYNGSYFTIFPVQKIIGDLCSRPKLTGTTFIPDSRSIPFPYTL
jgi:hypothetical protein